MASDSLVQIVVWMVPNCFAVDVVLDSYLKEEKAYVSM